MCCWCLSQRGVRDAQSGGPRPLRSSCLRAKTRTCLAGSWSAESNPGCSAWFRMIWTVSAQVIVSNRWQTRGYLLAAYIASNSRAGGLLVSKPALLKSCYAWLIVLGVTAANSAHHRSSFRGLRRDDDGWQLWSMHAGGTLLRLRPGDGIAAVVVTERR